MHCPRKHSSSWSGTCPGSHGRSSRIFPLRPTHSSIRTWFRKSHMIIGSPPLLIMDGTTISGEPSQVHDAKSPASLPPTPPNRVWTIPAKGGMEVHWVEPEGKIVGYHVYRREGKEIIRLTSSPVQRPPYLDTSVKRNIVYFYAVSAVGAQQDHKEGLCPNGSRYGASIRMTDTGSNLSIPAIRDLHLYRICRPGRFPTRILERPTCIISNTDTISFTAKICHCAGLPKRSALPPMCTAMPHSLITTGFSTGRSRGSAPHLLLRQGPTQILQSCGSSPPLAAEWTSFRVGNSSGSSGRHRSRKDRLLGCGEKPLRRSNMLFSRTFSCSTSSRHRNLEVISACAVKLGRKARVALRVNPDVDPPHTSLHIDSE